MVTKAKFYIKFLTRVILEVGLQVYNFDFDISGKINKDELSPLHGF